MNISCQNATNDDVVKLSKDLYDSVRVGFWINLVISINGITNNCILLTLAYRRRWYRSVHYSLILHQAIVDLFSAIAVTVWLSYLLFNPQPIIMAQTKCMAFFVPVCLFLTYGQRSAMIVAIDRLVNVTRPQIWLKLGLRYRVAMIIPVCLWAVVQQTRWFYFLKNSTDTCVLMCCSYGSYPVTWWANVVTVGDMITSVCIVAAYIALPPLSGSVMNRLNCSSLIVALDNMEQKQRTMVKCVRHLSLLTVTSFLMTTFIGTVATDFTANFFVIQPDMELKIQLLGTALATMNTVVPFYLFLWREKTLRKW